MGLTDGKCSQVKSFLEISAGAAWRWTRIGSTSTSRLLAWWAGTLQHLARRLLEELHWTTGMVTDDMVTEVGTCQACTRTRSALRSRASTARRRRPGRPRPPRPRPCRLLRRYRLDSLRITGAPRVRNINR